jgi:hypothetical protein
MQIDSYNAAQQHQVSGGRFHNSLIPQGGKQLHVVKVVIDVC